MSKNCKQDLIDAIAEKTGDTKASIKQILDLAFENIESMATEEGITIHNFGTFKYKTRAARTGRDPRTQQPISIPEKVKLTFTPTQRS